MNEFDWNSVSIIAPTDNHGLRIARVFCKHPTLTFNEWWITEDSMPKFVGINEPPDDLPQIRCSGEEARELTDCFLETGKYPQ